MKLISVFLLLFIPLMVIAQTTDDKHDMKNFHVSIAANKYKSSRFLDKKLSGEKEYIFGKSSNYNKKGIANGGKALWPYAEYIISSKMPGGTYTVTVHYRIDKEKAAEQSKIMIGMDMVGSEEVEIKKSLLNVAKATFNVKFLKGKKHTVKIWFPTEGVEIHKIDVNKALINKK